MLKRGKLRLWSTLASLVLVFSFCLSPLAANAANAANVVVDVVLYTGDTTVDASNFPTDLKTALGKLGVDTGGVRITNPQTTSFNVTDSFAWTVYDHTGYWGESPYPNGDQSPSGSQANKHIIIKNGGKNITFYGYGRPAFKDFMFMPNSVESKKTFTFDLNESGIKYHSMEGGGFLFNSQINNGILKGYAIIFDQGGMELFEITGVNATSFHEEQYAQMRSVPGIKLLQTFGKGSSKTHSIKIEVTPEQLDVWDNNNPTIANYKLPVKYGNGFGPIATHNSHDCNELSYFTFDNLKMSMTQKLTLKDVINNSPWAGCNKYVVNLADKLVPDLEDQTTRGQILAKTKKDNISYVAWGTAANKDQALSFIQVNNNNGSFVENADYAKSVDEIAALIFNQIKNDVAAAKAGLKVGFANGEGAGSVTKNLTLPVTGSTPCIGIQWNSNNQSVIANNGVVTPSSSGDTTVMLTATITKLGIVENQQFTVTVKKREELVKTGSLINTASLSSIGLIFILAGMVVLRKKAVER